MNCRSTRIAPWMERRARLLHGICSAITRDRANGMSASRAYSKGRGRFNRSLLARRRKRHLAISGMRAIYALWAKTGKRIECFAPKWKQPDHRKITVSQAHRWVKWIIAEGISASELYRRLKVERPTLNFSLATLHRNLPGKALSAVAQARRNLWKAERAALRYLELKGAK
jgi:hypothetical protein